MEWKKQLIFTKAGLNLTIRVVAEVMITSGTGPDLASKNFKRHDQWIPSSLPDGQTGQSPNGQRFASFPRKRESGKSAIIDSRLRGSDMIVGHINYPNALRSGKLLAVGGRGNDKSLRDKPKLFFARKARGFHHPRKRH